MRICVYNSVTVTAGKERRESRNSMTAVIGKITEFAYGGFLAVGSGSGLGDDGKLKSTSCTLKTTVGDRCFDCSRGNPFARFEAVATDDDLAEGARVGEVGLCGEAGGILFDYASFEPVVKKAGESIYFCVEVRLLVAKGSTCFCGGDNSLVAALLGAEKLEGSFEVASGYNYHANAPFERNTSNIVYRSAATLTATDGELSFAGKINGDVYEALLLKDGTPVMRCYDGSEASWTLSRSVGKNLCCDFIGQYSWLGNVTYSGSPVSTYERRAYVERLTADGSNPLPFRLPPGSKFLCEPYGNYVAVESEREVAVYALSGVKLGLVYKVGRRGEDFCLCSDGSLFAGGDGVLVRYTRSGGANKVEYPRSGFVRGVHAVVREGVGVGFFEDGDYVWARISDEGELSEIKRITSVPSDFFAWRVNDRFVAYLCPSSGGCEVFGLDGDFAAGRDRLKPAANSKYVVRGVFDEWAWVEDSETGSGYAYSPMCVNPHAMGAADHAAGVGAIIVKSRLGSVYRASTYYNSGGTEKNLNFPGTASQPFSVGRAGAYLLLLASDGSVTFRACSQRGFRLFLPYLGSGSSVRADAIGFANPNAARGGVNVRFTVGRAAE